MELQLKPDKIGVTVKQMLASRDRSSIAGLATEIGMHENTLRSALNNEALRVRDLLHIAEVLGFSVIVKDNEQ